MATGYDAALMDHIRNARNYRAMPQATMRLEAENLVCGDHVEIFLDWDGDRLADASFQCECCGISMASSSVLTERLIGLRRAEARDACADFLARVEAVGAASAPGASKSRTPPSHPGKTSAGERAVLATVAAYPTRTGCAAIAWRCVLEALDAAARPSGPSDPSGPSG
jgi:nitrogen fixation NifU-like protein